MSKAQKVWIRILTFGTFIGWLAGILGFCGVDLKKLGQIMTAHYLFLLLFVVCFAGFVWGLYLWWESSRVTTKNVEQKIKEWVETSGFSSRIVSDEKMFFGRQVSIPPRFIVTVQRRKDRPSYLTLVSRIILSKEQKDFINEMPDKDKQSVYRTIRLECGRLKIGHHMHEKLEVMAIHKLIPITSDLKEARIIDGINEMNFCADVVMDTIDILLTPPSQVPNREASEHLPTL